MALYKNIVIQASGKECVLPKGNFERLFCIKILQTNCLIKTYEKLFSMIAIICCPISLSHIKRHIPLFLCANRPVRKLYLQRGKSMRRVPAVRWPPSVFRPSRATSASRRQWPRSWSDCWDRRSTAATSDSRLFHRQSLLGKKIEQLKTRFRKKSEKIGVTVLILRGIWTTIKGVTISTFAPWRIKHRVDSGRDRRFQVPND